MKNSINVGDFNLNPIKLILKPAVAAKLGFRENSLQWWMCRADVRKDRVDLSGFGMIKDSIGFEEHQLDALKLSDYPLVFKMFKKGLKKKGFDMDAVKELHSFYFRVDYSKSECYSQLFFLDKDDKHKKTPNIISTF